MVKMINYKKDDLTIFSRKLANYLEDAGFKIRAKRPDLKCTGRDVFLFEDTPQLRKAIDTYMS